MTYENLILEATDDILDNFVGTSFVPSVVSEDVINACNNEIIMENTTRVHTGFTKYKQLTTLTTVQVARILLKLEEVKQIDTGTDVHNNDKLLLGVYQKSGDDRGTYITGNTDLRRLARNYKPSMTTKEFNEVCSMLHDAAPIVKRCEEKNLVAVNNGIFHYDTKVLESFTPDLVFLSKCPVDYNHAAQNIVIHNDEDGTDWDIESWMIDMFDNDTEVSECCWESIGACIRPLQGWDKCAFFYGEAGNGGKGTICSLIRNLLGRGAVSLPLSDMDKRFSLEPVLHATAIITDENKVNEYLDDVSNLKALITNDVLSIEAKFQMPVSFRYKGFMIQCLNGMPKVRDKSDSFYRRQLFLPFFKCFTGKERKYIKNDYLKRKEVLEYVLYRVLNMNYTTLSEPAKAKELLREYKEFNDPIRRFLSEMLPELKLNRIPMTMLYDLYNAWYCKQNNNKPDGTNQNTFTRQVKQVISDYTAESGFAFANDTKINFDKDNLEPLLKDYKLYHWIDGRYSEADNFGVRVDPAKSGKYKSVIMRK